MSLFDTLMTLSDMTIKHEQDLAKKPASKKGAKK